MSNPVLAGSTGAGDSEVAGEGSPAGDAAGDPSSLGAAEGEPDGTSPGDFDAAGDTDASPDLLAVGFGAGDFSSPVTGDFDGCCAISMNPDFSGAGVELTYARTTSVDIKRKSSESASSTVLYLLEGLEEYCLCIFFLLIVSCTKPMP